MVRTKKQSKRGSMDENRQHTKIAARNRKRSKKLRDDGVTEEIEPTQKRKLDPISLLLSLPPELRNMVYSYFVPQKPMEIGWNFKVKWPHPIVALVCSHPQIRKEASSYMLFKGVFHILTDREEICSNPFRDTELAGLKVLLLTILGRPDSLPTAEEVSNNRPNFNLDCKTTYKYRKGIAGDMEPSDFCEHKAAECSDEAAKSVKQNEDDAPNSSKLASSINYGRSLLDLPLELRNMIYEYLLTDSAIEIRICDNTKVQVDWPHPLRDLIHVNHEIYLHILANSIFRIEIILGRKLDFKMSKDIFSGTMLRGLRVFAQYARRSASKKADKRDHFSDCSAEEDSKARRDDPANGKGSTKKGNGGNTRQSKSELGDNKLTEEISGIEEEPGSRYSFLSLPGEIRDLV
ncbi:hypothetical protein E8E13_003722 [Curvularia kusanoi]|uniref:Uncharacterized protein n=1 Tax=Curvularia kusanoi TaxID=90978 RepID=A0A9P4TEM1_CURKU|nr:hypothetical protein E8E13_003722 [Curvularia kusanoi]